MIRHIRDSIRRLRRRLTLPLNAADYGATGLGVADDTAGLTAAIAAVAGTYKTLVVPGGTYRVTSVLAVPADTTIDWQNVKIESTVANGPTLALAGTDNLLGRLEIDCNDTTGSVGLRLGGATNCQHATVNSVWVHHAADCGVELLSTDTTLGVYHNHLRHVRATNCGTGVRLLSTDNDGINNVNANHFGSVSIQNCTTAGLVVNGADGNTFDKLEAENNAGWAIDLVQAIGFVVNGGWVEDNTSNLRIADYPAVGSVFITASFDSALISTDPKFSHTFSNGRAVQIRRSLDSYEYGVMRYAGQAIFGKDGAAANDQEFSGRIAMTGNIDLYRHSAASPYFAFRCSTGSNYLLSINGGTTVVDCNTTRFGIENVDLRCNTAGKGLGIKSGANCKMGQSTLAGGTVTVTTTAVGAGSQILLTRTGSGTSTGQLRVASRVNGTSFTVTSTDAADAGTFDWLIVERL